MAFGGSLAPRVFTWCVAAALSPMQARGWTVEPDLNDWLTISAPQAVGVNRYVPWPCEPTGPSGERLKGQSYSPPEGRLPGHDS